VPAPAPAPNPRSLKVARAVLERLISSAVQQSTVEAAIRSAEEREALQAPDADGDKLEGDNWQRQLASRLSVTDKGDSIGNFASHAPPTSFPKHPRDAAATAAADKALSAISPVNDFAGLHAAPHRLPKDLLPLVGSRDRGSHACETVGPGGMGRYGAHVVSGNRDSLTHR
jgi:hypothetical protein